MGTGVTRSVCEPEKAVVPFPILNLDGMVSVAVVVYARFMMASIAPSVTPVVPVIVFSSCVRLDKDFGDGVSRRPRRLPDYFRPLRARDGHDLQDSAQ